MATVGSLGGIIFNVSSRRIVSFGNYKRSRGVNVSNHNIIAGLSKKEYTGLPGEQITLDIQLLAQLNSRPEAILKKLRTIRDTGQVVNFILGGKPVSQNKWLLTQVDESVTHWKKRGDILVANASITLEEYEVDSVEAAKSTPWGNVGSQVQEIKNKVDQYQESVLDIMDRVEDELGDVL